MTDLTWVLLGITIAIAAVDWWAVSVGNRVVEYVAKPATMVPLIGAALALTPAEPAMRPWFVAALVFSLAGDVFLMIPKPEQYFVPGLASFLVGHVLYIVGLARGGLSTGGIVIGAVITFTVLLAIGPTLVKGASEQHRALGVPVLAYMVTISVMVSCAIGAGPWIGIVGAGLFYLSDFCIGWSRFVQEFRGSRPAIMITYHLAQVCLVASLVVSS